MPEIPRSRGNGGKYREHCEISARVGSEEHGEVLLEPRTKDNEVPAEVCVRSSRSAAMGRKTGEKFEKSMEWEQRAGLRD